MEKKTDLRILKTKKNIYEAFISLMSEKSFEEIKVSEICERALINRSTFYSHFDDKYTLFDSLISYMRQSLIDELGKNDKIHNTKEYYMEVLRILLNDLEVKKDLYRASLLNNRNSIAMDMIYSTLKEDVLEKINNKTPEGVPADFIAFFYLGAIYSVCLEWIKDGYEYPKDDIVSYIDKLIPEDIIRE